MSAFIVIGRGSIFFGGGRTQSGEADAQGEESEAGPPKKWRTSLA